MNRRSLADRFGHFEEHLVKVRVSSRNEVVRCEHDLDVPYECDLGDDVDGSGLELDQEDVRSDGELGAKLFTVRELPETWTTFAP